MMLLCKGGCTCFVAELRKLSHYFSPHSTYSYFSRGNRKETSVGISSAVPQNIDQIRLLAGQMWVRNDLRKSFRALSRRVFPRSSEFCLHELNRNSFVYRLSVGRTDYALGGVARYRPIACL